MPRSVSETTPRGHPHHKKKKAVVTTVFPSGKIRGGTKKSRHNAKASQKHVYYAEHPKVRRIVRHSKHHPLPTVGQAQYLRAARHGTDPSTYLKRNDPAAYKAARKVRAATATKREALKEDPIAEFVIDTAVTAGVGSLASLAGRGAAEGAGALLARGGEKLATKGVSAAESGAESGLKALAKKGAGKALTKVKRTPQKVKRAPKAVKQSVKKPSKAGTARAGKSVKRHPVRYSAGAQGIAVPAGINDTEAGKRIASFAKGNVQAATSDPIKYADTTRRALPGFVTVPAKMAAEVGVTAGRAVSTAAHAAGAPGAAGYSAHEISGGLTKEASMQKKGFEDFVSKEFAKSPKTVKKAALEDYGATPFAAAIPIGHAIGKVTKGRLIVKPSRRIAERLREARGKEHGGSPKIFEKKSQRGEVSRTVARGATGARSETAARVRKAKKAGQKAGKGKSVVLRTMPKGKRGVHEVRMRDADMANLLIRNGIDASHPDALKRIEDVLISLRDPAEIGMKLDPSKPHSRDILSYALTNEERVRAKHLLEVLDSYRAQERHARENPVLSPEYSERARWVPMANTYGKHLPEERTPPQVADIVRTPPKKGVLARDTLRTEVKQDKASARKLRSQAKTLEGRASGIRRELKVRERTEPGREVNITRERQMHENRLAARQLREQAKVFEDQAKRKRGAADQEAGILNGKRPPDEVRNAEFVAEMSKLAEDTPGLVQPEWTPTNTASTAMDLSIGSNYSNLAGKSKFREGTADLYGLVDESFSNLLRRGIAVPVARRWSYAAVREIRKRYRETHQGRTEFKFDEAKELLRGTEDTPPVFNARTHLAMPVQTIKRVDDILRAREADLISHPEAYVAAIDEVKSIIDQARKNKEAMPTTKGRTVEIWRREAAIELEHQLEHRIGTLVKTGMEINKVTSFLILGTSPAWAAMQIPAELGQASLQHARLLNPKWVHDSIRAYEELPPHKRQSMEASTGTLHRVLEGERDWMQLASDTAEGEIATGYGVFHRTWLGNLVRRLPQSIRAIDNFKGGRIRLLTGLAHIDEMNGPMNRFLKGISGMDDSMREFMKATKGMTRAQRYEYVIDHPELRLRVARNVDESLGNWTALTRYEKPAALVGIFYPFMRMSLRWIFHDFPKNHPIRFTISTYLAQQNAVQLKKLLHGEPGFFGQWGMVPFYTGGDTQIMDLSRIAPGSNALIEAMGGGEGPFLGGLLRAAQPIVGAGITATTGYNPISGHQEPGSGIMAINQLASLSPLSRNAETLATSAQGYVRSDKGLKLLGSKQRQNALDKLFDKLKGPRSEQLIKGLVMPAIPQPVDRVRDLMVVGRALGILSKTGTDAHATLEQTPGTTHRQSEDMWADYEKAQKVLTDLYKKYKIPYKKEEAAFRRHQHQVRYGAGASSAGLGGGDSSGSSGLSGGLGGGGGL